MIDINSFSKSKSGSSGSSGSVSSVNIITRTERASEADKLTNTHKIWGNDFNGTQDVNGNLVIDRNKTLTVKGDVSIMSYYNPESYVYIDEAVDSVSQGEINIKNMDVDAIDLNASYAWSDSNNTVYIDSDGLTLHGTNSIHSNNINVDVIDSETADVITVEKQMKLNGGLDLSGQSLTVDTLYSNDITNDGEIKTQDLTVYGNLNVFNLVIGQIEQIAGTVILSPANFAVDVVEDGSDYIAGKDVAQYYITDSLTDTYHTKKLYQLSYDEDKDKKIAMTWLPGDYAFCHTFNLDESTSKHYWTVVVATQTDVEMVVNGRPQLCNMIEIIDSVTTTGTLQTTLPEGKCEAGDEIACLGSKNATRRDAIMIASSLSYDAQVEAPCIVQYTGINTFSLKDKQYSYLAKNGNRLRGNLLTTSGLNYDDYLKDAMNRTPYVHVAYANAEDGSVDFTKTNSLTNPLFIGFATDYNLSDEDLVYTDYVWSRFHEEEVEDDTTHNNILMTVRERLYVAKDGNLYIDVAYSTHTLKGDDVITCTCYTADGQATTYTVQNTETDLSGTTYRYLTQKLQDSWSTHSSQFIYARVLCTDNSGNEIDSHSFAVTWDAGAMMEITDSITSRVSDCEGNISTIKLNADSITARVQSLEAAGSPENPDSIYSRVGALEIKSDEIDASVSEVKSDINNVTGQLVNTANKVSEIEMTLDGIDLSAIDRAIGGTNILDYTNFGNFPGEISDVWTTWNSSNTMQSNALLTGVGQLNFAGSALAAVEDYVEVARQSVKGELKPDTWYTLSFYAHDSDFTTYVYPNVGSSTEIQHIDGEASGTTPSDCNHRWTVNETTWTKHKHTFKTAASITTDSDVYFLIRCWKNGDNFTDCNITQLKLEEGQVATSWEQSEHDFESHIKVTSTSIDMTVRDGLKKTGIDIESGQITLDSTNTTINGTLNITNAGSGLIIMDDDNTPRVNIRKEAIGEITNLSKTGYGEKSYTDVMSNFENEGTFTKTFTTNIGQVSAGEKLTFQTTEYDNAFIFQPTVTGTKSGTYQTTTVTPAMTWQVTLEIKVGTEVQYTKTTEKTIYSGNTYKMSDCVWWQESTGCTFKNSGEAVCTITVKQSYVNHLATLTYCSYAGLVIFGYAMTCNLTVIFGWKKAVTTLTKLGTDGIYMAGNETNQFMYFGPSGFEVMWREPSNSALGFKVSGYNVPKILYNSDNSGSESGNTWGLMSSIIPGGWAGCQRGNGATVDSNNYIVHTCTADESFLVATGTERDGYKGFVFTLPNNSPCGKIYYIKDDVTGIHVYVLTYSTQCIVAPGKHMTEGSTWYQMPGLGINGFIYDGQNHWHLLYTS